MVPDVGVRTGKGRGRRGGGRGEQSYPAVLASPSRQGRPRTRGPALKGPVPTEGGMGRGRRACPLRPSSLVPTEVLVPGGVWPRVWIGTWAQRA